MNSYLFREDMVCHLTISDDTGFVCLFLFPVYINISIYIYKHNFYKYILRL